jgi:hypothetical protein
MSERQKLAAPGRHQLQLLEEDPGSGSRYVSLFLRGHSPFSSEELAELVQDGVKIRTAAGNILTIDVPISSIDRVLSHDFVVSGDLSGPLYPEREDEPHIDIG